MKVLVCGSRSWRDYDTIYYRISRFAPGTLFIHGGASGADSLGARACREQGFEETAFPARWRRANGSLDRSAGLRRNIEMLNEGPDVVVAFWDGSSRGTAHTIEQARRRGIPVEVFEP